MVNKVKIWANVLQAPVALIVVAAVVASFYAAKNNIGGITYGAGVVLLIAAVLFAIGKYLEIFKANVTE